MTHVFLYLQTALQILLFSLFVLVPKFMNNEGKKLSRKKEIQYDVTRDIVINNNHRMPSYYSTSYIYPMKSISKTI